MTVLVTYLFTALNRNVGSSTLCYMKSRVIRKSGLWRFFLYQFTVIVILYICVILCLYKYSYFNTVFFACNSHIYHLSPLFLPLNKKCITLIRYVCYKSVDSFPHQWLVIVVECTFYTLKSVIRGGMMSKFKILCVTMQAKIVD